MKAAEKRPTRKTGGRRRDAVPPYNASSLDALRQLDEAARHRLVDYVASGVPLQAMRQELERERGLVVDDLTMQAFFQKEAARRYEGKIDSASLDADSVIHILRNSNMDFSEALLQKLGQETFRMITQRELDFKQVEKFTRLLLQARGQDNSRKRAEKVLELQRAKLEHQMKSQIEKALEALAGEMENHPEARELFDRFCAVMRGTVNGGLEGEGTRNEPSTTIQPDSSTSSE